MNATLRDRLILLEQHFLIAVVAQDEATLRKFSLELPRLIHHFKAVEVSGDLDDETALLLSRVSQVIKATTQCVLECEDVLKAGIIGCSSLPVLSDDLAPATPTFTPYRLLFTSGTLGTLGNNNLLDACAYRWLMHNMHSPYPTPTQLQVIGDESKTPVAQAERWFQEARDLTGWTKLSNEFFTGSLNATITAAKRVFLEHDNTIPFCIAFAFSKVKASMETLFAEHPALPLTSHVESSVQALRPVAVDNDSTHVNDLLDNEDERIEDTTPPPPVAGCKRNRHEDTAASVEPDLHRPLKRLRAQSLHHIPYSEDIHPLSNSGPSFKKSTNEALTHTPPIYIISARLSDPSPAFDFTGSRQTDLTDSASGMDTSSDPPASQGKMYDRQFLEDFPPGPSERQLSPSRRRHPPSDSVPTLAWPILPSLDHPPTGFAGASQITVNPGAPVDLSVFDWNSISNPLAGTTMPTNLPASVYVPSSDLAPLNFGLPGPLYAEQSTEKVYNPPLLDDLGSLEDFSLLQFPIPTTLPPDVSTPPASFCSDNSYISPEMDWSAITDFINQFSSFSAESSSAPSPSSTIDAAPSTPENPIGSLLPPPSHEVNKPISILDPSIPPSAFLPAEPGIFTDDGSSMWSLLCGLS